MAPTETPEVAPEKKIEDNIDNQDAAKEKIQDKLNSWLEAIDTDIVKNYLSTKLVGKEISQTTPEEKKWLAEISEAIFKRIKKTQRVPLDITINSWISWVMSMIGIFSSKAEVPSVSSEKISQVTSTVWAFDKIRDQFEGKITKAMSQFQSLSTWWAVMGELENAFTSLEQKVTTLKENKDTLKDKAKESNMSIKAYYQSQTRLFINEFITQLKWEVPAPKVDVKNTPVATVNAPDTQTTIDTKDATIWPRIEQVKTAYQALDKKYTDLNGKWNFEHKDLTLIDPKEKSIIVDPKTQTLYYLEKWVAKNIIQVWLWKWNWGDVSAVNESHSTPPGTLTVFSDKVNQMSDGRPSLLVDGLEEQNKNTDKREILIHPTGVPGGKVIDKPTSLGCITMDTAIWDFCKEHFSKWIMIQVIDDKFDAKDTAYFKQNVAWKIIDFATPTTQKAAA